VPPTHQTHQECNRSFACHRQGDSFTGTSGCQASVSKSRQGQKGFHRSLPYPVALVPGYANTRSGPYGRITLAMARAQAQKIFVARLDGRTQPLKKQTHGDAWSSIAWTDLLRRSSLSGCLACGPALPSPIGSAMTSSRDGVRKASMTLSGETSSIS